MQIIQKPWGVTRCVHQSPNCEVWHASVRAGSESSYGRYHHHDRKINGFYILSGKLRLLSDTSHILGPGDTIEVPPGVSHRFVAITDVEMIETYTLPAIDQDDIVRQNFYDDSALNALL